MSNIIYLDKNREYTQDLIYQLLSLLYLTVIHDEMPINMNLAKQEFILWLTK